MRPTATGLIMTSENVICESRDMAAPVWTWVRLILRRGRKKTVGRRARGRICHGHYLLRDPCPYLTDVHGLFINRP